MIQAEGDNSAFALRLQPLHHPRNKTGHPFWGGRAQRLSDQAVVDGRAPSVMDRLTVSCSEGWGRRGSQGGASRDTGDSLFPAGVKPR